MPDRPTSALPLSNRALFSCASTGPSFPQIRVAHLSATVTVGKGADIHNRHGILLSVP
jgi:hypothetical protein